MKEYYYTRAFSTIEETDGDDICLSSLIGLVELLCGVKHAKTIISGIIEYYSVYSNYYTDRAIK